MRGGIGNLMKKAQQMQAKMQEQQEALAKEETSGESGGGLVKVVMNGKHEVRRITIDESLFEDDKDMLEDLLAAAINDTVHKVAKKNADSMSGLTDGLNLPPGMKLPF
ncbi:MAG: YbaB/EbfC family nucleoid-associated protein [Candidatus Polarisedimenticolaceae bacterium]|nr:YbaB/EbfC family nucleoid-associated protein [Candidatus Polarisedimenticolaceae bacterium]